MLQGAGGCVTVMWPMIRGFMAEAVTKRFSHSHMKIRDVPVCAHNQELIHMKMQGMGLRNSLWLHCFLDLGYFAHQYALTTAKDVCSDQNWQLVHCFTPKSGSSEAGLSHADERRAFCSYLTHPPSPCWDKN